MKRILKKNLLNRWILLISFIFSLGFSFTDDYIDSQEDNYLHSMTVDENHEGPPNSNEVFLEDEPLTAQYSFLQKAYSSVCKNNCLEISDRVDETVFHLYNQEDAVRSYSPQPRPYDDDETAFLPYNNSQDAVRPYSPQPWPYDDETVLLPYNNSSQDAVRPYSPQPWPYDDETVLLPYNNSSQDAVRPYSPQPWPYDAAQDSLDGLYFNY